MNNNIKGYYQPVYKSGTEDLIVENTSTKRKNGTDPTLKRMKE